MALFYLLNNVWLGAVSRLAGELVDSDQENTATLTAVGGILVDASIPGLSAAADRCITLRLRGGDLQQLESIMSAAVDDSQTLYSHTQNTDSGTTGLSFDIASGASGPKLKAVTGGIAIRNHGDTADANINGFIRPSAGSTSFAPVVFTSGALTSVPVNGALEYNGTAFRGTLGGVRKTVAWAEDAIAGHAQNTDTGTTQATWQLDSGAAGPLLKDAAGTLQVRDATDTAAAPVEALLRPPAGTATAGTASLVIPSGTLLTVPLTGAIEHAASHLYATLGGVRIQLDGSQPVDATLTALAGMVTAANQLILCTGADAFSPGQLTDAYVATANKDGLATTPSLRTIGTGALQAASGADTRFHAQGTDVGTTSAVFQIDSGNHGPKIKNSSGTVTLRNEADSAYAQVSALLRPPAGTIVAGTAPFQMTAGPVLTVPVAGAWEYDGTYAYFTPSAARKTIAFLDSPQFLAAGEPTGFVNRTDSQLSFVDGTLEFTIGPKAPATSFSYWDRSVFYTKSAPETITITNVKGQHWIYYIGATLTHTTVFPGFDVVSVGGLYWNGTRHLNLVDERHGLIMDSSTHGYLHYAIGCRFQSGFTITHLTTGTAGAVDTDCQVSLIGGIIRDEDIDISVVRAAIPANPFEQEIGLSTTTPGKFPIFYKSGTGTNNFDNLTATTFPCRSFDNVAGHRIGYNLNTAGTWTIADPGEGNYVAAWVAVTTSISEPVIVIMGQRFDTSLGDAQNNNNWGVLDLAGAPVQEIKHIYRLIFKTSTVYANSIKAYIAEILDTRAASSLPDLEYVPIVHGALSGRTATNQHPTSAINTSTANFNGLLSSADTDVQKALDTIDDFFSNFSNGFRLTTQSLTPVPLTDRLAQTTLYVTPYKSNRVSLFDGTAHWKTYSSAEIAFPLGTLTSGVNYDVFLYNNAGVVAVELSAAWADAITRTNALVRQDGVWVKAAATTRLYIGTIRMTSTTATEQSAVRQYVWNYYNQEPLFLNKSDVTASWTQTVVDTWRVARSAISNNWVEYVCGQPETLVRSTVLAFGMPNGNNGRVASGIGIDSSTVNSALITGSESRNNMANSSTALYRGRPGQGYHLINRLERCNATAGTTTWYGAGVEVMQSGIVAEILG
jgi:hypothetical protein